MEKEQRLKYCYFMPSRNKIKNKIGKKIVDTELAKIDSERTRSPFAVCQGSTDSCESPAFALESHSLLAGIHSERCFCCRNSSATPTPPFSKPCSYVHKLHHIRTSPSARPEQHSQRRSSRETHTHTRRATRDASARNSGILYNLYGTI